MEKPLRWGVLGCAGIAIRSVIPGIQQSKTGKVVAIASRNKQKAEQTALELSIEKAYDSYEALLSDQDIDAVYIPLPNHLHMEWTIKAAEAGKHVLCEKPIALNAAQAQKMVDACEKAGVFLAEAFMYRHHPRYRKILDIIKSGEIGDVRSIHANFTFNNAKDYDNIRFKKEWGGGSIYDVGAYPISVGRLLLGSEPHAVTVHALFSPEHDDVDMMASGLIEYANGVGLTFDCGMWGAFRNSLEILGSDGRIEVPSAFVGHADFTVYSHDSSRSETFPELDAFSLQVDQFAHAINGKEDLLFPASDAVLNMKVIDACLRSARERVRVQLGGES